LQILKLLAIYLEKSAKRLRLLTGPTDMEGVTREGNSLEEPILYTREEKAG